MAVLTDKEIERMIDNGLIDLGNKERITSNGYDLSLEDFKISPGETKLVLSKEKIKMPNNLISIPFLRTTYAFKGLYLSAGIIDAGYSGHLKFCLTNPTKKIIELEKEDHLRAPIHLIFLETKGPVNLQFGERADEKNDII